MALAGSPTRDGRRRSLNSEIIVRLERSLGAAPMDGDALLARARAVRERLQVPYLDDDVLREAEGLLRGRAYLPDGDRVLELVERSDCNVYDCEYVAVAEALDTPLLARDRAVFEAFPDVAVGPEACSRRSRTWRWDRRRVRGVPGRGGGTGGVGAGLSHGTTGGTVTRARPRWPPRWAGAS